MLESSTRNDAVHPDQLLRFMRGCLYYNRTPTWEDTKLDSVIASINES